MSYKLKLGNGDKVPKTFDTKEDAKIYRADYGLGAKVIEE